MEGASPTIGSAKAESKTTSHMTQKGQMGRYGKSLPRLFKYEDCEVRAMLLLAYMYFNGIGVIENLEKTVFYLVKITKFQGIREGEEGLLAEALYRLGELHYKGIAVKQDDVQAEKCWFRGASLQKDPATDRHFHASVQCQTALGMFYSNSEKDDVKKAFYWHKKATESGSIISEGEGSSKQGFEDGVFIKKIGIV
ncbi:LRP2-binding protein-like [Uloborus diversus]|uniref:LRP2-binding protein-like n=1 Tax=Uloborus diversus TaxID=327109 RepID=UPI0024099417|nr:LRP2-binding protein-like [Uloborus diversus]